jgi:hypothetical protein
MIWFRSANSHTGPQLHRCIRGRTDGSIRLRANPLQKPLALGGASTDEYNGPRTNSTPSQPAPRRSPWPRRRTPRRRASHVTRPPPYLPTLSKRRGSSETVPWLPQGWPRDLSASSDRRRSWTRTSADCRDRRESRRCSDLPLAGEDGAIRAIFVDPGAKAGRAHDQVQCGWSCAGWGNDPS